MGAIYPTAPAGVQKEYASCIWASIKCGHLLPDYESRPVQIFILKMHLIILSPKTLDVWRVGAGASSTCCLAENDTVLTSYMGEFAVNMARCTSDATVGTSMNDQ